MCEEAGVVCAQGRGSGANVAQELAAPGQGPPAGPCAAGELPAQAVPGPPQIANAADRPVSAAASRQCPGDCLVTRPPSQGVQHPVAAPRDAASAEERSSRGGDRHNPDNCRLSESRKSYRPRNHGKQTLAEPGADGNAPESDHGPAFPRPSLARHPASVPPRGDRGRQRLLPPLFTPTPVVLEGGNVRLEFDNVITNNTAAVPGGQSSASPLLPEQFRFSALPRRHDGAGKKEATQAFSAHKAPLDPSIAVVPEHRPRHHSVVDDVLSPFRKLFAPVLSSAGSPVSSRPGSAASGKQSPAGFSSSEEEEAHAAPRGASRGFTETRLRAKYGKLGRVVGRGSGGTVRLIRRNMDNKLFAVKELRQRAADEDRREYTKRLTNEFCIGGGGALAVFLFFFFSSLFISLRGPREPGWQRRCREVIYFRFLARLDAAP
ncbi:MAG: hypothetical protein BJ554DRAFT_5578 [Olpidium bornovanus]|uniref:Uncharacterized protein n=1 Tax=Olpidium bornovanus TaxID=278681 RepID=A0A8H8DKW7_9FUNG|nr:MAG: hypothetical protein BJ554DRAFT_5578 [Olpidium bornovanus]